jgi:hypothetical protein
LAQAQVAKQRRSKWLLKAPAASMAQQAGRFFQGGATVIDT